jgi:hypothetical protein
MRFDYTGNAGDEAEREDDNEGQFGAFVDLELQDDGNRKDGEEEVGDDVDDRVEKSDEAVCAIGKAACTRQDANAYTPACGYWCTLEYKSSSTRQCKAGQKNCSRQSIVLRRIWINVPTELHKKTFQRFCIMMRMRKNATEILTRTTPSITIKPCANSHRKYGSNIHGCCHSLCRPMPYDDSAHKQMKVPTAIDTARIIDQSSSPTKRSMHVRTYSRRATTTSAAVANAPVIPRMEATLLSSRYAWLGFATSSICRRNTAGMLLTAWAT